MIKPVLNRWKKTLVDSWNSWTKPPVETLKLPCPFCMSEHVGAIWYLTENGGKPMAFVACNDCGARGPGIGYTLEYATESWNKALRPAPPTDIK